MENIQKIEVKREEFVQTQNQLIKLKLFPQFLLLLFVMNSIVYEAPNIIEM